MIALEARDFWIIGGGAACLLAVGIILRRRKSPAELELERRTLLNARGRLAEGNLVQLMNRDGRRLVCFQYSVGQVSYSAAQDISDISVKLEEVCEGLPARVKYDPQNPGNSIVACENWSGLG